jgi:hypoxanthine phosphoribosyltransferase
MISIRQAHDMLQQAEMIRSEEEVQAAVVRVATEINAKLADRHPLVLSVMGGAVIFTGQLLPMLNFPLDFDYVHVSRYGNGQRGGAVCWKIEPGENVVGRVVLVVDDILDEGETLAAIRKRVLELGASGFYSAVFADKLNGRNKPAHADFIGMELPDRFVFGFGMDIQGAWRNLPAIYAMKEK